MLLNSFRKNREKQLFLVNKFVVRLLLSINFGVIKNNLAFKYSSFLHL